MEKNKKEMSARDEARLTNIIIDAPREPGNSEGQKLVNLLNRNNEYVVCDLTQNNYSLFDDIVYGSIHNLVSPFNLMYITLSEKIDQSIKTHKPLIVYGLPMPEAGMTQASDGVFGVKILECTYLFSLLFPLGFVLVRFKGLQNENCIFPTVSYDPEKDFLVDLMDGIVKKHFEECSGNIQRMMPVLNGFGYYLSMTNSPKRLVTLAGFGSSSKILPHEYFLTVINSLDKISNGIGQYLGETAFVRSHCPFEAIAGLEVSGKTGKGKKSK